MAYILPLCAATINGVTPYFLALFKAACQSIKNFVAPRRPHPAETRGGVESSVLVQLTDISLRHRNFMIEHNSIK
jgi:hypothetical protein